MSENSIPTPEAKSGPATFDDLAGLAIAASNAFTEPVEDASHPIENGGCGLMQRWSVSDYRSVTLRHGPGVDMQDLSWDVDFELEDRQWVEKEDSRWVRQVKVYEVAFNAEDDVVHQSTVRAYEETLEEVMQAQQIGPRDTADQEPPDFDAHLKALLDEPIEEGGDVDVYLIPKDACLELQETIEGITP